VPRSILGSENGRRFRGPARYIQVNGGPAPESPRPPFESLPVPKSQVLRAVEVTFNGPGRRAAVLHDAAITQAEAAVPFM
jgi:hypothetical protein